MLNNIMKWTALLLLSGVFELARLASGLYLIDVIKKFCGKRRGRGGGGVRDCRLELEVKNGEMITKTENTPLREEYPWKRSKAICLIFTLQRWTC